MASIFEKIAGVFRSGTKKKYQEIDYVKLGMAAVGHKPTQYVPNLTTLNRSFNPIPGSDDAYNTIEGLPHGGMAQVGRVKNTHFGSGLIRDMASRAGLSFEELVGSKSFKSALSAAEDIGYIGGGGFSVVRRKRGIFEGEAFEFTEKKAFFPSLSSLEKTAVEANAMSRFHDLKTVPDVYGFEQGVIRMEAMEGKPLREVIQEGGVVSEKAKKDIFDTVETMRKAGYAHADPNPGNVLYDVESGKISLVDFGSIDIAKPGITSQSLIDKNAGKLIGEMKELFGDAPASTGRMIASNAALNPVSSAGEAKSGGITASSSLMDLIRRDSGVKSSVTAVPKIAEGFHTIDGMGHKGISHKTRKAFGSKYDLLRKMAEDFGESYEQFLSSGRLKAALASGVVKEELGRGAFGVVERMETTIGGKQVIYARKRIHEEMKNVDFGGGSAGEGLLQRSQRSTDLRHEASIMERLQNTEFAPSVYGEAGKHEMFMEFMEHQALPDVGKITNSAKRLEAIGDTVSEAGIANPDIHLGNLGYSTENKSFVWVDWGMATKLEGTVGSISKSQTEMMEKLKAVGQELSSATPFSGLQKAASLSKTPVMRNKQQAAEVVLSKTPVMRNKNQLIGLADTPRVNPIVHFKTSMQLQKDQRKIWEAGIRGGRGHTGKAGKIIQ